MPTNRDLVVIGASGFGKEVAWLGHDCGYNVSGFLDDNPEIQGKTFFGLPILGKVCDWQKSGDCAFAIGIGSPRVKRKIVERMLLEGEPEYASLLHPSVIHSNAVQFGKGVVICAGCILTTDIHIGSFTALNLAVTVGHDTVIGNYCTIAPQAVISGNVTLDDFVEVGTAASIRQGLRLYKGSMLGMGSVLTKDLSENSFAVGTPAKAIKKLEE